MASSGRWTREKLEGGLQDSRRESCLGKGSEALDRVLARALLPPAVRQRLGGNILLRREQPEACGKNDYLSSDSAWESRGWGVVGRTDLKNNNKDNRSCHILST